MTIQDAYTITPAPEADPVLVALAEYLVVLRSIQVDVGALTARLDRIESALGVPAQPIMCDLTGAEILVINGLVQAYSHTRPHGVRTEAIAAIVPYAERTIRDKLRSLCERKIVRIEKRGRWLPPERHLLESMPELP
jgi:hypothetical protein